MVICQLDKARYIWEAILSEGLCTCCCPVVCLEDITLISMGKPSPLWIVSFHHRQEILTNVSEDNECIWWYWRVENARQTQTRKWACTHSFLSALDCGHDVNSSLKFLPWLPCTMPAIVCWNTPFPL